MLTNDNGSSTPEVNFGTGGIDKLHHTEDEICNISRAALLRVLQGVAVATKTALEDVAIVSQCITSLSMPHASPQGSTYVVNFDQSNQQCDSYPFFQWYEALSVRFNDDRTRQIVVLVLCVAYLRQHSRQTQCAPVSSKTMAFIWELIHRVLTDSSLEPPLCTPVRSAQGFFSIALCSLIENGCIDELFRLHVWLPDARRKNQEYRIHSHQPFAQSWILAGEGVDVSFDAEVATEETATHAEGVPAWSDGKTFSTTYKTHQTVSTIMKTGVFMTATPSEFATHTRDMTYTVPSAHYHSSVVRAETIHATLFFFDSHRGFRQDAPVLIRKDGGPFVQRREVMGITAAQLAGAVEAFRSWETLLEHGRDCARSGRLEDAVHDFAEALKLCARFEDGSNPVDCREITVGELENAEKRLKEKSGPQMGDLEYTRQLPIPVADAR